MLDAFGGCPIPPYVIDLRAIVNFVIGQRRPETNTVPQGRRDGGRPGTSLASTRILSGLGTLALALRAHRTCTRVPPDRTHLPRPQVLGRDGVRHCAGSTHTCPEPQVRRR